MKVLLIGSTGQLGYEIVRQGNPTDLNIVGLDLPYLDITLKPQIIQWMNRIQANLIINASAYTQVDNAENDPETAFAVNRDGPDHLADVCRNAGIPLIHVSTDYVFNGEKTSPYVESDPVSPEGIYGQSKADGEARVRSRLERHLIVRTSWLFGVHGRNFVKTMLRLGQERKELGIVADQFGCPTAASDLAGAILKMATQIQHKNEMPWGTYHFCNRGVTSWYDFSRAIFSMAEKFEILESPVLSPIKTSQYPTPAKRPAYSAMDTQKIRDAFDIVPPRWQDGLRDTLLRLSKSSVESFL